MTVICDVLNLPGWTVKVNPYNFLTILGYSNQPTLSYFISYITSLILNVNYYYLNLIFSVGTKPAKNILIPSLTVKGIVTTP